MPSARRDAEELACFALGIEWSKLAWFFPAPADPALQARYGVLVEKRAERTPLQLLTGQVGFRKLTVEVRAGVFIPRPETEILVEAVIDHLASRPKPGPRPSRVLEIGAGSGAVALSIAAEAPGCFVVATDISPSALRCAKDNAVRLGLEGRIDFVAADLFSVFGPSADSYFDVVVSNPPYIPTEEIEETPVEVKRYDPKEALDGGDDGLSVVRRILEQAPRVLAPGGLLAVEVGDGQADIVARDREISKTLKNHGMQLLDALADLSGAPRVLRALKSPDLRFGR